MYVSDKKVDKLADLLPDPLWKRLEVELSVSVGVPGAATVGLALKGLKAKPTTRRRVLADIEKGLAEEGRLGSIEEPCDYFKGTLTMRWGIFEQARPMIAWFIGSTPDTVVAFGGRARHLTDIYVDELENRAPPRAELRHVEKDVVADLSKAFAGDSPLPQAPTWANDVLKMYWYWGSTQAETVEFLAKKEEFLEPEEGASVEGGGGEPGVLLGSPVLCVRSKLMDDLAQRGYITIVPRWAAVQGQAAIGPTRWGPTTFGAASRAYFPQIHDGWVFPVIDRNYKEAFALVQLDRPDYDRTITGHKSRLRKRVDANKPESVTPQTGHHV